MRGTHYRRFGVDTAYRIIPAYAGNAPHWPRRREARPDHPRVCGERVDTAYLDELSGGSSPRMRGTRVGRSFLIGQARIIPAYAGNALTYLWPF